MFIMGCLMCDTSLLCCLHRVNPQVSFMEDTMWCHWNSRYVLWTGRGRKESADLGPGWYESIFSSSCLLWLALLEASRVTRDRPSLIWTLRFFSSLVKIKSKAIHDIRFGVQKCAHYSEPGFLRTRTQHMERRGCSVATGQQGQVDWCLLNSYSDGQETSGFGASCSVHMCVTGLTSICLQFVRIIFFFSRVCIFMKTICDISFS
jgi:hypothetical protein